MIDTLSIIDEIVRRAYGHADVSIQCEFRDQLIALAELAKAEQRAEFVELNGEHTARIFRRTFH